MCLFLKETVLHENEIVFPGRQYYAVIIFLNKTFINDIKKKLERGESVKQPGLKRTEVCMLNTCTPETGFSPLSCAIYK